MIKVDLEELILSFGFDEEELAKEYFDKRTGEIINIPSNVMKAAEGYIEVEELEDWERELFEAARAVFQDTEDRYLVVPNIPSDHTHNAMIEFTEEVLLDKRIKEKLNQALSSGYPMREFKTAISNYTEEQDLWYEYEDKKIKEYVIEWLKDNKVDFEYA